jgi:hypothetical protein
MLQHRHHFEIMKPFGSPDALHPTLFIAYMRWRLAFTVWVVLFASLMPAHAQITPLLRDTQVQRGQSLTVPVQALVPVSVFDRFARLDSVRLMMSFTPAQLTIQSVTGGGAQFMQCPAPRIDSTFQSKTRGTLIIRCDALQRTTGDTTTFCTLTFGTLVSNDSLARISLDSVVINGVGVAVAPRIATILVQDTVRISEVFTESLGQNFPNANEFFTTFPYTISTPTSVSFTLFTPLGQQIGDAQTLRRSRGAYTFVLAFDATWTSGTYYLRMQTDNGVYWRRFMILR